MPYPPVQHMKAAGSATLQRLNWRRFQLVGYRSGEINGFCHIHRFGTGRMIEEGIQTEAFRARIDDSRSELDNPAACPLRLRPRNSPAENLLRTYWNLETSASWTRRSASNESRATSPDGNTRSIPTSASRCTSSSEVLRHCTPIVSSNGFARA